VTVSGPRVLHESPVSTFGGGDQGVLGERAAHPKPLRRF
jgi:hypothetical protein